MLIIPGDVFHLFYVARVLKTSKDHVEEENLIIP